MRATLEAQARTGLARLGYRLQRLDDDSRRYLLSSYDDTMPLPAGAAETLTATNPQLQELTRAYEALDLPAAAHSQWTPEFIAKEVELEWFRGDNAYVWQFRQMRSAAEAKTYLSLLEIEARDELGLLTSLDDDGAFGAWVFRFGERPPVTRDLLDSVNELNYLQDKVGLTSRPELSVLDIGAGYGRLAHRMSGAVPNLARYDCIDAIAVSTFLCDYYLSYRGVPDTVRTVRLDQYETLADRYDLAVNVHSFSECTIESIRWWVGQLEKRDVEWLFIVPNAIDDLMSTEADGSHLDYRGVLASAGYELVDQRRSHVDPELTPLIGTRDGYFLFRRTAQPG